MNGSNSPSNDSLYRSLIEGSVQGILIHANGVVRFANQAVAKLAGIEHVDTMIGQSIWPFICVDDRPLVARYAQARAEGRAVPTRYDLRIVRQDGTVRWVDCVVTMITWEGEPMMMAAVVDVTDRKQAEAHLQASEERFRLLADNIKEAFIIVDVPTGRALYLSRVWEEIWGRRVEEAYANPRLWFEAIDADDQSSVASAEQRLFEGHAAATQAFRVHRPDGSMCWARARMFPVRNDCGEVYRLVGLIEDITSVRHTEQQLRQALKMDAIGRLAGGIAHDFNNLLVVMGGYADLIAEALDPANPLRKDVDEIRAAAKSATGLTQQLLAFSRRQILQPQVLDLNQALRRVERLLRRVIGEHIALAMQLGTPLARVHVDPGQLEQIIVNLAVNARDAMPTGGRLTIETADIELDATYVAQHPGASVGPHVMIAVSDTGAGIDEATKQRLFEPFFTTKAVGHGTGLGLSTVYGIVKQSHGSIFVYSEVHKGSTFKIFLPVSTTLLVEESSVACAGRRHLAGSGSETVLVVEDQLEVRRLIVDTLQRHQYRVVAAANGFEAVELARDRHLAFDLLLTDVVLPGSSGRDIARQVVASRPIVRVLYMSGYTDEAIVHHGILDAGLAFLQKPFTAEALLTKIRDVLEATEPPPW